MPYKDATSEWGLPYPHAFAAGATFVLLAVTSYWFGGSDLFRSLSVAAMVAAVFVGRYVRRRSTA